MKKKYTFDENFYTKFYPDIKCASENNSIIPLEHYNKHGIMEKRVCCQEELNDIVNKNTEKIKNEYKNCIDITFKNPENKFNILIRTSMRPEFFKLCINSILTQKYNNYHIYICYDNTESLSYLNQYKLTKNITFFFIENDSTEKYKFNLYNNTLMDMVDDGFIMFLDDDDVLTHNLCLKIINENIIDENSILIWKFMRPDKLVYPKNIDDIKISEIDTTSLCFNCKYKNLSKWSDKQCGDFYFYTELFRKLKEMNIDNIIKVNYILTKTIYSDKVCGSL